MRKESKETQTWDEGHRPCRRCYKVLPYSMFHKHKDCAKGINSVCKDCRKPQSRKNYKNNSPEYNHFQACKSRANAKHLDFDLTIEDFKNLPKYCPVFGREFNPDSYDWCLSIDRVDNSRGYVRGNIQFLSNKANRMKSNASVEDLLTFSKWVLSLHGSCEI